MNRQVFLIICGAFFFTLGLLQGCGTPVRDGQPVAVIPNVVQVEVNKTVTITVPLSKPRQKAGKLFIIIGDTSKILPSAEKTEIAVAPGESSVTFGLQGIAPGITTVGARMDNEGETVTSQVVVGAQ